MHDYFVTQALEVDSREAKLPAWAREKLHTMRRETTEARQELVALKTGSEPGPFWLEGWRDRERFYLPRQAGRLMFGDPSGDDDVMTLSDQMTGGPSGWLNLNGRGSIVARPWSANVLLVRSIGHD